MIRTMQMITGTIQTITIRQYKRNQTYTTIHQAQKPCWSSYRTRANSANAKPINGWKLYDWIIHMRTGSLITE